MSETKMYILSAGFSLTCAALLIVMFSYTDKSNQIRAISEQTNKGAYLNTQLQMNQEMASIMLPLLRKQRSEEENQKKIKKPDTVYVPEQLMSSRGY